MRPARKALMQAVILVALSAAAAVAAHFFHPLAPAWYLVDAPPREDEVTVTEVRNRFGGETLWLDARPSDQFAAAHIPGAHSLNEQDFDNQLFQLLDTLQTNTLPVVIYCDGERCEASRKIKERLLDTLPLENVWILKGGLKAWREAGGAVE